MSNYFFQTKLFGYNLFTYIIFWHLVYQQQLGSILHSGHEESFEVLLMLLTNRIKR